jgi:hypothetical protein
VAQAVVAGALATAAVTVGCAGAASTTEAESAAHVQRSDGTTTASPLPVASSQVVCDRIVEDFSGSKIGEFPAGWRVHGEDDPAGVLDKSLYVVEEQEGQRVLHAKFLRETVTIALVVEDWSLAQRPVLQWRWKAVHLPVGGKETDSSLNDTGAAVYAIWHVGFPFHLRGIKYAWSSTLPVGTRSSKRLGHDQMLVVESGNEHVGSWQTVRVDVRVHYRTFFGRDDSASPTGIAVMTDADATSSQAEAYYADFRLCRVEQASGRSAPTRR